MLITSLFHMHFLISSSKTTQCVYLHPLPSFFQVQLHFLLPIKFCVFFFLKPIKSLFCHPYNFGFVAFSWGMVSVAGAYALQENGLFYLLAAVSCQEFLSQRQGFVLTSPLRAGLA